MHRYPLSLFLAFAAAACCASACGGKVFVDVPGAASGSGGGGGTGATLPTGSCEVCAEICTDLSHDAQNCGACGNDCPLTEICEGGHCQATPCFSPVPCSNCCGEKCCGIEELCCGNATIGFSCISATGLATCPVQTCNASCSF